MKRLSTTTRAAVTTTFAFAIMLESALLAAAYFAAARQIRQDDPRKSGNLTGTLVFARPKVYRLGERVEREEIIKHLSQIGFQDREGTEPGTYHASGNRLQINSRLPELPGASISIEAGRVTAIIVDGRTIDQIEVEPQTLMSFMRMVRDDQARKMNVRRIVLPASALIPSPLYDAVRASEDKNFDSHNGIDEIGMLRGLAYSIKSLFKKSAGGSTITQQMVKNVVLKNQDRTLNRKAREFLLALAAERMMSKEEIFAAYANNCYLGHIENGPTILGFASAAQELFGVAVRDLTLAQAATLAAMLDKPETYLRAARDNDYSLVTARRDRVLTLMQKNFPDRYSEEVILRAKNEPLRFIFASEREPERSLDIISKPFENFAASQVANVVGADYRSGNIHIFTTLDPELQIAAYKAVIDQLTRLDPIVDRVRRGLPAEERGDGQIQAAVVAMDAQSGETLAMVGGRDSEFNHATAKRSLGSAIKPFVYLQAIAQGTHEGEPFTAATMLDPRNDKVDNYRPQSHVGGRATARALLARSDNGAAVIAAHDAGLASVRELIEELTGSYSTELTGMLAIGGSAGCEVSPLNLAEAYSIFPNNGLKVPHTPFAAIYQNGIRLNLPVNPLVRITDPGPAYVVTQMLRSVLKAGGTASNALSLAGLTADTQISAKTGTGQVADLYFAAFSKRLVVVVWVGMPNNKPALEMKQGFSSAHVAMPIWASFIRAVKQYRPDLLEGGIEVPESIRTLKIDPQRGCVTDGEGITEYFVRGREPKSCSR